MLETQEQSLKSEDTSPQTIDVVIEPMATQYRAIIPMSKEDLQILFDEYWEANGEALVKGSGYKGKKQKGGKVDLKKARRRLEETRGVATLYQSALASWANEYLDKHYESIKEKVMFVTEARLDKWDTDEPFIICFFYFWPVLNYFEELDFNLKRAIPRDPEKALEGRLKDLQNQFKFYTDVASDELTDDMEVLMDIIASIDGVPYTKGTIRSNWFHIERLSSPELREAILAHKMGDLFEVSFKNTLEKPEEGSEPKQIDAQVKIYDARIVNLYDQDDPELYKAAKFESKEDFIEKFHKEYDAYMKNTETRIAFDEIMGQLVMGGKLEPIPQVWIQGNAVNFMQRHIESKGGDKAKAQKSVRANSDFEYKRIIEGQVIQDTINRMAVRYYAAKYNIPDDPEVVSNHIWTQVNWVE